VIVQYLNEYITAMNGDAQKIAEFEERYGYTPKPFLRDGLKDARYYQLTNKHPNEASRLDAAVKLLAVVFHEPKVAPARGKQREVIRQWLLWLSGRQEYTSIEELVDQCRREIGTGSVDTLISIINQTLKLTEWQKAVSVATASLSHLDSIEIDRRLAKATDIVDCMDAEFDTNETDFELLEKFKNTESYLAANAKDKKAMRKAFANMSDEERVLYFALD